MNWKWCGYAGLPVSCRHFEQACRCRIAGSRRLAVLFWSKARANSWSLVSWELWVNPAEQRCWWSQSIRRGRAGKGRVATEIYEVIANRILPSVSWLPATDKEKSTIGTFIFKITNRKYTYKEINKRNMFINCLFIYFI